MSHSCPFCSPLPESTFHNSPLALGLWDQFPVSTGHALLIPRRHIATWFDATREEHLALLEGIDVARAIIDRVHHPSGYNIGVNVGRDAGQTVFHLHVHVIPRYEGDVPDPTGGVRHVIPGLANYLDRREGDAGTPHDRSLISGYDDPLFPHLAAHLATADRVDIAVAFVLVSGLQEIRGHLQDLIDRGGHLRLLTGDYCDVTDPVALRMLLDLASGAKDRVELSVFNAHPVGFHPKSFILKRDGGGGIAFVGSSNLTLPALRSTIEWNYRLVSSQDAAGFRDVCDGFDRLFSHPSTEKLTDAWIDAYAARRRPPTMAPVAIPLDPLQPPPKPNSIQERALAALTETRLVGNKAGLVVLATGLGKTWLSAFDSSRDEFRRILFVAHREEILKQSLGTFRRIRPAARLGLYMGQERDGEADIVFASVQTLSRSNHLQKFRRDEFDYIVIDEFHHAEAQTYRRILQHFDPKFLLGLTATPERTDGGDLLALCGENRVFRCDLVEGIEHELLCPFHYFGVPDTIDYRNIPWRSGRFDPEALDNAVVTHARAENALKQYNEHAGKRTLAFCCSVRHADYMAKFFRDAELRAVAVHGGPGSAHRAQSLERLSRGELDILCVVDIFNEGLDLPQIDTVLMLRPTESRILWLQQIGRGLRRAAEKTHLTIIDYVGNHRSFLFKPQALLGLHLTDAELARTLALLRVQRYPLPPGCEITYDLAAIDILEQILRRTEGVLAVEAAYDDLTATLGSRPTASQLFHEGFNPAVLRSRYGSWFEFVRHKDGLSAAESKALENHRDFLVVLETTRMTRSYKMLILSSMLDQDRIPGGISLVELRETIRSIVSRSARLAADFRIDLSDSAALDALLLRDPIPRLIASQGAGGQSYFDYEAEIFRILLKTPANLRLSLQEMVREIVEWRLNAYLLRCQTTCANDDAVLIKVNHANGRPILHPLNRRKYPQLPRGWTNVRVGEKEYELNFVSIAVNIARERSDGPNVLPDILRGWFGSSAGAPGTNHFAVLHADDSGYCLTSGLSDEGLDQS